MDCDGLTLWHEGPHKQFPTQDTNVIKEEKIQTAARDINRE